MKQALTFLLLLCSLGVFAQVSTNRATFGKQTFEALQIDLDADYELVADKWKDFWDDRYDVDFDKLDKDRNAIALLAEQASVSLISTKNMDLYAKVSGSETAALVNFAVTFTAHDVVSETTHAKSFTAAKAILLEFRTFFYTSYFGERLEEAREDLEDVRDDGSDDSKDAAKARKKIKKYEDKIADYTKKIEELREEVGEELESAEEKARRAKELEEKVRQLERLRAKYLG